MRSRMTIVACGALTAVMASGYGVLFTLLDDYRDRFGISETALGGIVAIGFLSSVVSQFFIAPLADRGHVRLFIVGGVLINLAGLLVMAYGTSAPQLLVGRFVMGVGIGIAHPAIRRVVVLSDTGDMGGNLGLVLSADIFGFAAGPAISAVLAGPFGLPAPFLFVAGVTLACLPLVMRIPLNEPDTEAEPTPRLAFDLLRNRAYAAAVAIGCGVFLMIGTFDALWSLVLDDLHASTLVANLGITLFAIPLILMGRLSGRLAQRVGPFRIGVLGLALESVFIAGYGVMSTARQMFFIAMCHALVDGLSVSSSSVAAGMTLPPERQAAGHGLLGGMETLVGGMTALLAGYLYEHHGRATAYGFAAAGMTVCWVLARILTGDQWAMKGGSVEEPTAWPAAVTPGP